MASSPAIYPHNDLCREALLALVQQLEGQLTEKDRQLAEKDKLLNSANEDLAKLIEEVQKAQRLINSANKKIYGSTSEKLDRIIKKANKKTSEDDYIPFEEVQSKEKAESTAEDKLVAKPKRKYKKPHPGRLPLPADLERRDIHLYPEEYNGSGAVEMPPVITERLAIRMDVYVERIIRHKVNCSGKLVVASYPVDDPCFRCKFSLPLVTNMLMLRFVHHMPYYRILQLFPHGIIGYNTLIGAATWAFDLLAPLAPVLLEAVKKNAQRIGIDESHYDILDTPDNIALFKKQGMAIESNDEANKTTPEPKTTKPHEVPKKEVDDKPPSKKKIIHTGRVWVITNELEGLVYYEYAATRGACIAERLLDGYSGPMISDAYIVYITIASKDGSKIILMLCWSHARRHFRDLVEKDFKKTDPVVLEILRRIGELYHIEKIIKDKTDAEKLEARKQSAKILESLKEYLDEKVLLYTPKEGVAQAINYLLNHWQHFTQYINHAAGVIDNNYVERAVKTLTLDRKNSLFFGSVKQSAGNALVFSLFQVCKNHNVNFLNWMTDVLKRIKTHPPEELHELLPHKWVAKDP